MYLLYLFCIRSQLNCCLALGSAKTPLSIGSRPQVRPNVRDYVSLWHTSPGLLDGTCKINTIEHELQYTNNKFRVDSYCKASKILLIISIWHTDDQSATGLYPILECSTTSQGLSLLSVQLKPLEFPRLVNIFMVGNAVKLGEFRNYIIPHILYVLFFHSDTNLHEDGLTLTVKTKDLIRFPNGFFCLLNTPDPERGWGIYIRGPMPASCIT